MSCTNMHFAVLAAGEAVASGTVEEEEGEGFALFDDEQTSELLEDLLGMLGLEGEVRLALPIEIRIKFARPTE